MVSRSGGVAEYPLPPLPFMSLFLLMRLSFPFSSDGRCFASHLRLSVRRVSQLGHSWRSGFRSRQHERVLHSGNRFWPFVGYGFPRPVPYGVRLNRLG